MGQLAVRTVASGVFCFLLSTAHAQAPQIEGAMRLLCASSDRAISRVVDVDLSKRTANGVKAQISDIEIKWETVEVDQFTKRNVTYDHSISRLTGVYRSFGRGIVYTGLGPTITCEKAPSPKF